MKFYCRLLEEKDNLNTLYDIYSEPKTAYYVVEDEEGNIVSGLGVYKIEGNNNRCELKDYFIIDSFCDTKVIEDLVNVCIKFSKKYYNSVCIKVFNDDIILMKALTTKKFKLTSEKVDNLDVLENQKLYLLKYKTVGWKNEIFDYVIGEIVAIIILVVLGLIVSLFLPDKCVELLDFEWLMVIGGFVFIIFPCLIYTLICTGFKRKDKKK